MPFISIQITSLEIIKLRTAEMAEIVRTSSNTLRPVEYLHSFQLASDQTLNPTPNLLRSFPPPLVTCSYSDSQPLKTTWAIGQVLSHLATNTTGYSTLTRCITWLSYTVLHGLNSVIEYKRENSCQWCFDPISICLSSLIC